MKTWHDFNVKAIREIFDSNKRLQRYSSQKRDDIFDEFMEIATQQTSIDLPCLTCGVNFPMKRLDHVCQAEDIWVNGYVHNAKTRKRGYQQHVELLRQKYPWKKQHRYVFRGKNFATPEEYEAFMRSIKNGHYLFRTVTSWTTEYDCAVKFASVMQKGGTSAPTESVRKRELLAMFENKANITGFTGVILGHRVRQDEVLCDIGEAQIGGFNEHELILLPGKYQVEIVKQIDRKCGVKNWNMNEEQLRLAGVI